MCKLKRRQNIIEEEKKEKNVISNAVRMAIIFNNSDKRNKCTMNHEKMKCWVKVEHANAFIIFTSFQCNFFDGIVCEVVEALCGY